MNDTSSGYFSLGSQLVGRCIIHATSAIVLSAIMLFSDRFSYVKILYIHVGTLPCVFLKVWATSHFNRSGFIYDLN